MKNTLQKAADGNLTESIPEKYIKNDQIGSVALAYNYMRNQMHDVLKKVITASNLVQDKSDRMNRSIEEIFQSSEEITRAIEEIS